MACKLRCPECKTMLKEKGDQMKSANGEYEVFTRDGANIIKCLVCGHTGSAIEFCLE